MPPCPARKDGIHDLTKGKTCACGFELARMRYALDFCVFDNDNEGAIVCSDVFETDDPDVIADALRAAADKMETL